MPNPESVAKKPLNSTPAAAADAAKVSLNPSTSTSLMTTADHSENPLKPTYEPLSDDV